MVERLLVDGVDRGLRREHGGVIKGSDLEHHRGQARHPRDQVRAAFGAKLPRDGPFEVRAGELFWRALGVFETIEWHGHEHVWAAAGHVLALTAMTLRLHHWFALGRITHRPAVTSAFQLHDVLPVVGR